MCQGLCLTFTRNLFCFNYLHIHYLIYNLKNFFTLKLSVQHKDLFFRNHWGFFTLSQALSMDSRAIYGCLCVYLNLVLFLYLLLYILKNHMFTLMLPILMQLHRVYGVFLPLSHSEKCLPWLVIDLFIWSNPQQVTISDCCHHPLPHVNALLATSGLQQVLAAASAPPDAAIALPPSPGGLLPHPVWALTPHARSFMSFPPYSGSGTPNEDISKALLSLPKHGSAFFF